MTRQDLSATASQQTLSVNGHVVSILGFSGLMVSVRTIHLCCCLRKEPETTHKGRRRVCSNGLWFVDIEI